MTAVRKTLQNINNLLSKEQTKILETALTLMIPVVLTKIAGQLFNLLAASRFGVDDIGWNQFLIANTIPELLTNVLLIGAVGSIIIPTLISCKKNDGEEHFLRIYSSIINISMILFTLVSVLLVVTASEIFPFLIDHIINPAEEPDAAEMKIIINMMRVLLIPQIILGVSVFVSSGINVYNRFLVPQLAGLFFNLGRIFAVIVLVPLMDFSPWAMVLGTLIGSILHLLVQLPLFFSLKLRYIPTIKAEDPHLLEVALLGLPRMLALASEHIAFAFNKFLAFGVNGIAALTFANSLSLFVPSLFGFTFSSASYPTLAALFVEKDYKKIESITIKTLNEILFLSLPFTIIIMVLRVPVVRLSFGLLPNTNFSLDGTYQVAWILLWFGLGWVFVSGKWYMYRLFYAAKDTLYPLLVSLFSLFLTIVLSLGLTNLFSYNNIYAISDIDISVNKFLERSKGNCDDFMDNDGDGVIDYLEPNCHTDGNVNNPSSFSEELFESSTAAGGIALAMSIAYSIEFFLLLGLMYYKQVKFDFKTLLVTSYKKFLAGGIMFAVMYLMYKTWNSLSYVIPERAQYLYSGSTTLNLLFLTSLTVIAGFIVYILLCLLFKVDELKILKKYLNPVLRLGGIGIK